MVHDQDGISCAIPALVHRSLQGVPRSVRGVPRLLRGVTRSVQDVPWLLRDVPWRSAAPVHCPLSFNSHTPSLDRESLKRGGRASGAQWREYSSPRAHQVGALV